MFDMLDIEYTAICIKKNVFTATYTHTYKTKFACTNYLYVF